MVKLVKKTFDESPNLVTFLYFCYVFRTKNYISAMTVWQIPIEILPNQNFSQALNRKKNTILAIYSDLFKLYLKNIIKPSDKRLCKNTDC